MNPLQRYRDWCLEREIRRLARGCREAYAAGDKAKARHFFHAMGLAMARRSTGQIVRLEERKGLRIRISIKRRVMDAFLRGRIPSTFVVAVFKLLRLRSL